MRRAPLAIAFSCAIVLGSTVAAAAPRDPAAAEVLFREGRARVVAKDYAAACPKFAESMRLDPAPGTLLNLADCEEHTGKLATAWEHFHQLAEQLPPSDERQPLAEGRAQKLEKRLPRLTIALAPWAPPGTRVARDDVELEAASLGVALPVDPGEHVVVVRAPGARERTVRVAIGAGESRTIAAEPGEAVGQGNGRRIAGWVVGGVGVAALGTGAYFGLRALSKRDQSDARCVGSVCPDAASAQAYDDAKSYARIADVSLAVGIVAVGVAGFLLLTSTHAEAGAAPPQTALRVGAGGVGLAW